MKQKLVNSLTRKEDEIVFIKNLNKNYNKFNLLKNISFSVKMSWYIVCFSIYLSGLRSEEIYKFFKTEKKLLPKSYSFFPNPFKDFCFIFFKMLDYFNKEKLRLWNKN